MFRISSSLSSIPCSFCAVRKVSCAILFSVVAVASWVFNWATVCVASSRSWFAELCSCCVKKATKEEDQIAKNILAAKVNEARKLDGEKKRIVKATTDALTTANQQLQETEKTIETANKTLTQAQQSIQQQTTNRQQTQQEQSSANQLLKEATQTITQLKTQEVTATTENKIAQDTLRTAQKEQGIEDREEAF
jgi:membrane-associated HD superfamily phosphohydrolase